MAEYLLDHVITFMPIAQGQQAHHWLAGGLSAASFAAVLALIGVDSPDKSLQVALMLFAIALPLDIFIFVSPLPKKFEMPNCWSDLVIMFVCLLYAPMSLGGIAAVFWHFGYVFGVTFLTATFVLMVLRPCLAKHWKDEQ